MYFRSTIIFVLTVFLFQRAEGQLYPLWQTYFGGAGNDSFFHSIVTGNGDYILTGSSSSETGMPIEQAVNSSFGGGINDAILVRFNSEGQLLWWTFFGGDSRDYILQVVENPEGDLWVFGMTTGNVPISEDAIKTENAGPDPVSDCFIARFDADGEWLESTLFGGENYDKPSSLSIDEEGRLIITGTTNSPDLAFGEVYDSELHTEQAIFVAVLQSVSELVSCSYFEGNAAMGSNDIGDLAFRASDGNLIIYGSTTSTEGIATEGAEFSTPFDSHNGFVVKITPLGFPVWGSYFPYRSVFRHARPLNNDLFALYGMTFTQTDLSTPGAHQAELLGENDGLLSVWTQDGEWQWTTFFGGEDDVLFGEDIRGVCFYDNRIIFSGVLTPGSNLSTSGAWQTNIDGIDHNSLGYFGWFTPEGELEYCSYVAHPEVTTSISSVFMDNGALLLPIRVSGYAEWIDSPQLNQNYSGDFDLCLMKLDLSNSILESSEAVSVIAYPNPAAECVYFTGVNTVNAFVRVWDSRGKECKSTCIRHFLRVDDLPAGVYFVQIQSGDGRIYPSRFIKE